MALIKAADIVIAGNNMTKMTKGEYTMWPFNLANYSTVKNNAQTLP